MNLVIVESPAKAKTIKKYLGEGFEVESSYGHITDLPKKGMGIDLESFEPTYEVSLEKKDVVKKLKILAKKADVVWLASDEDREGEAIAWHLYNELGLTPDNTRRIVFHEITKNAIQNAVKNPREINTNLVNAQQARRVLDRVVGFEMSPILWRKIKAGLSAGRVQSVAVRLICEREEEIEKFGATSFYRVEADFLNTGKTVLKTRLNADFEEYDKTLNFIKKCTDAEFSVQKVEKKPGKRSSSAPFTTSTLQQEASRIGFSVARTMKVAQELYEAGHITYMRTDSVSLSEEAVENAKNTILKEFGEEYSNPMQYTNKNKNAQEAHEAIRPTNFGVNEAGSTSDQKKLYHLIWRRTLACQMTDAKLEKTTINIGTSSVKETFQAKGEVIIFDGFLKLYQIQSEEEEEAEDENVKGLLPKVEEGEILTLKSMNGSEKFTKSLPRYSEASLVKKLEELGIGRPSTYAPTISTIQRREYVEIGDLEPKTREVKRILLDKGAIEEVKEEEKYGGDRRKLMPTDIGRVVNEFLVEHFPDILDYKFTAKVEGAFDNVASGEKDWQQLMKDFYKKFHPRIEEVGENAERARGERLLGEHPESKKNVYAKIGRFGPMIQVGENDDEEKPKFAGLMPSQHIATITLEEALKLFDLPKAIGEYEDKKVEVNIGRFGPYIKHNNKFISIKSSDGDTMENMVIERAIELIEAKREVDRNKFIKSFESEDPIIEILNGRWGPYIKQGKNNYKIPKDKVALELTLEDCKEIIGADSKASIKKKVVKKTATKKPATKK